MLRQDVVSPFFLKKNKKQPALEIGIRCLCLTWRPSGGSYHRGESRTKRVRRQCGPSDGSYHLVPKGGEAVRVVYKRPLLRQEASFFIEIYNWMELSSGASRTCLLELPLVPAYQKFSYQSVLFRTRKANLVPRDLVPIGSFKCQKEKIENQKGNCLCQKGNWLKNS